MEARIIGPESDLGPVTTLDFYGLSLSREWSEIKPTSAQLSKLDGNRYVEIRGDHAPKASADDDEVEEGLIRERLTELGVEVSAKAKLPALRTKLAAAETAKAAQDEEEAEAAAAADAAAAEQA
jgi:hypothetical protein